MTMYPMMVMDKSPMSRKPTIIPIFDLGSIIWVVLVSESVWVVHIFVVRSKM